MVSHYTAIVFLSAIPMFIMIFGIQSNSFMSTKRKRRFQLIFFLLILINLIQWLATYLDGSASNLRNLHIFTKLIEFILAPAIPFICAMAISGEKNKKVMNITIIVNTILQLFSLKTGSIFYVDYSNIFYRGKFYFLFIFIGSCSVIFLAIHCIKFGRRFQFNNVLFLSMIIVFTIGIVIIQNLIPGLNLDWTCISIATILFYIYYDQLIQQVDDMTTLMNRRSYNCKIENFRTRASILFFDVDNFKYINDTYGHSYGDECLIKGSAEIRKVFEKYGICYRFGGDEFCVIMTKNIENTELLVSNYLKRIEKIRAKESRFPTFSVGHVVFEPDKETIEDAIERADKIMYEFKETKNL